jgi:quinol monooxygenase YgiN
MYMRLVHSKYQPHALPMIRKVYDEKIIPQLKEMKGCLYACLIKNEENTDEGLSLTLWDSQENAESYIRSGMFQALHAEIKPYLSDTSEWKVQLSKDLRIEYEKPGDESVVKSYSSLAQSGEDIPTGMLYLRLLSLKVQPKKIVEFKKIYIEDIIPNLRAVKGCQFAYLTMSTERDDEAISLTVWDSKEDADIYEKSGKFKELLKKVKHTLSDLYQWKMSLDKEADWKLRTSEDMDVKYYRVVTGKSFRST